MVMLKKKPILLVLFFTSNITSLSNGANFDPSCHKYFSVSNDSVICPIVLVVSLRTDEIRFPST